MKTKITYAVVLSVILLTILPLVAAVETAIGVETLRNHQVTLNILNPNTGDAYKSLEGTSNAEGIATLTYTSSSNQNINIYAIIRNSEGKIVLTKSFESLSTGNAIVLKVLGTTTTAPPVTTPNLTVNETPKNTTPINLTQNLTITQNATNLSTTSASSYSLGSTFTSIWKTLITYGYIIGIIIILILLVLLIIKFWPNIRRKIDERQALPRTKEKSSEKDTDAGSPRELLNAEKKLKQLQQEIDGIKNKNRRIIEAERKFEDAKRELERLRRE